MSDARLADINIEDPALPVSAHKDGDNHWKFRFNVTGKLVGRLLVTFTIQPSTTHTSAIAAHWASHGVPMALQYDIHSLSMETLESVSAEIDFNIIVLRKETKILAWFSYLVGFVIILNNIGFGCVFHIRIAKEIFKSPVGPIIGLVLQFVLQPTMAFTLTVITGLNKITGLGLFILGTCPGGGQSNMWTLFCYGDVTLSIVMTFCSMVMSMAMMPLWLLTLGRYYTSEEIDIPFLNVFLSLLVFIIPLFVGMSIHHWLPKVAKVIAMLLRPLCAIYICVLVGIGIASHLYVFEYFRTDWRIPFCVICLPYIAIGVSTIASLIAKQSWPRVRTIAIETAIQNAPIAMVIVNTTLEHPDSDVAIVIALFAIGFAPSLCIIYIVVNVFRIHCCGYVPDEAENNWHLDDKEAMKENTATHDGVELVLAESK